MPTLTDPRAEASAQHRARGANLADAYELAGFTGGQGYASRFAKRRKVAARIGELIEAGRRQPVTGQDIAFELQRMVRHCDDFDTPQRMRETRESLMELRNMQLELERERYHQRERVERNSPRQARTSPKPPVSAWISPSAERAAVAPAPRPAARIVSPRAHFADLPTLHYGPAHRHGGMVRMGVGGDSAVGRARRGPDRRHRARGCRHGSPSAPVFSTVVDSRTAAGIAVPEEAFRCPWRAWW